MECKNHPGIQAFDRCAGCAEPFCANCLVDIQGQRYCAACKVMVVQTQPPFPQQATRTCTEARDALIISIVGLFCCGIILEPWALIKANNAKKMIDADPSLSGRGMATAATIIAIIGLALFVVGVIARIAQMSQM
jgi:hypothetical protein